MTPERARKIAQACADSWYGGAAGLTLKEAITQGILEACQETEGDLVATRAERDSYRQDLAAARADAERYRWIRDNHEVRGRAMEIVYGMNGDDWDAAIDAALAGEGKHG